MTEDLIRIEYKLDLIIRALQHKGLMIDSLPDLRGLENDNCPICKTRNKLKLDMKEGTIHKKCKCSLPKRAVKLKLVHDTEVNNESTTKTNPSPVPSDSP